MATREDEPVGPPFGIAHATVVPENFDPERDRGDAERRDDGRRDDGRRDAVDDPGRAAPE